jgi:hypothetical protein
MQSSQEIIIVYACDNAIHLSKSFAVRINFSGLCRFKFNSTAHPVVMLCQDGDRMYFVVAWQILQNWWIVDTCHYNELY